MLEAIAAHQRRLDAHVLAKVLRDGGGEGLSVYASKGITPR